MGLTVHLTFFIRNACEFCFNRPLKNVFEAADARQKQAKKRSLYMINEHFEPVFNTAAAMQIVFQRPVKCPWHRKTEEIVKEILIKLITPMVRQAHHERNQYITVRGEPVEGLNQRFLNEFLNNPLLSFRTK
jgi:hypothetical protein